VNTYGLPFPSALFSDNFLLSLTLYTNKPTNSAEQDPTNPVRLHLRGRPGQKAVLLEYADGNTEADNVRGAQQWAAALRFLIKMSAS
jgi:hypothetical protein